MLVVRCSFFAGENFPHFGTLFLGSGEGRKNLSLRVADWVLGWVRVLGFRYQVCIRYQVSGFEPQIPYGNDNQRTKGGCDKWNGTCNCEFKCERRWRLWFGGGEAVAVAEHEGEEFESVEVAGGIALRFGYGAEEPA